MAVDALLTVDLDGSHALFACEVKHRAPYPSEVSLLEPIRQTLASTGTPLLVVPYVSEGQG
ncbi:MAG: hypothetical protein ACRD1T_24550, partial [Acidimicrobiia bacterium]